MLASHPIVCGFGLGAEDHLLVDYCLRACGAHQAHDSVPAANGLFNDKLHWISSVALDELASLLEWGAPLLLVQGTEARIEAKDLHRRLFGMGLAAVWELPSSPEVVVFPQLRLPAQQGYIVATSDDSRVLRRYRQIAAFAGLDLRADFRDAGELLAFIEGLLKEHFLQKKRRIARAEDVPKRPGSQPLPDLILIDLDSPQIQAPELFSGLAKLKEKSLDLPSRLRLLITKDFEKPGLDIRQIDSTVRPWARRIFHPSESIQVLLEGLFLYDKGRPKARSPWASPPRAAGASFHSLAELLDSSSAEPMLSEPSLAPTSPAEKMRASRIEPFRWLYRQLPRQRFRGLVLSS